MKRPSPHDELTDPVNEKILGTLTPETWRGLSVEAVAAKWFTLGGNGRGVEVRRGSQRWHPSKPWKAEEVSGAEELLAAESPLKLLVEEARQSSGSIRGEHRKDLKDAIIGASPMPVGVGVPVAGAAPDASGKAEKPRRGL